MPDTLTTTVNEITITPELARVVTAKKDGAKLRLRLRAKREVVCYLDTRMYVKPELFDPITKHVRNQQLDELLVTLFARAVALVAKAAPGAAFKVLWERDYADFVRERERLHKEAQVEAKRAAEEALTQKWVKNSQFDHYRMLIKKRGKLEEQLKQMDVEIEWHRVDMNLPHHDRGIDGVARRTDQKLYQGMMAAFLTEKESMLNQRAFQMWKSWSGVLGECAGATGTELGLQSFDLNFYRAYKEHIMVVRKNTLNTFGAHVKKLKSFFKFVESKGHQLHPESKHKAFKIAEEGKDIVYLDDEELNMLWDYRLVRPSVMNAIHLTLFQSLTGLRISDAAKQHAVTKVKADGEVREFLTGKCQKNNGTYKVPLSLDHRIKEILVENSFDMKVMSEVVYNRDIKNILRDMYAHFGKHAPTVVIQREDHQGVLRSTEFKKHELFASHCNRRSFISRHINSREFNHNDVLEMIGSKDITELQKYIAIDSGALHQKATDNSRARTLKAIKTQAKSPK